jgi:hypothetical protein
MNPLPAILCLLIHPAAADEAPKTGALPRTAVVHYYLPPAINYTRQDQWLEFKKQHDAAYAKDLEDARRMNAEVRAPTPAPIYTYSKEPTPAPPGPPGRAEVTEFKDTFIEVVSTFLAKKSREGKGAFLLKDDQTGETLRLIRQQFSVENLRYHSLADVSGCVHFMTLDEPKRTVDLDFELTKDWEWTVSKIFVHTVNGRERYAYDTDGRRVFTRREQAPASVPKPKAPANLTADIRLTNAAEEDIDSRMGLAVTVSNAGPGDAYAVRLKLDIRSSAPGVSLPTEVPFGNIPKNASATKLVLFSIATGSTGGAVKALASVIEGNGFDTEPVLLDFEAAAPKRPTLELGGASLEGGSLKPGETARLSVSVRNTGNARAIGTNATLKLGGKDLFMSGEPSVTLGDIAPGESKETAFEFFVNKRAKPGSDLPLSLSVSDAKGRYGFAGVPLPVKMGQAAGPLRELVIKGRPVATPAVDVDQPPATRTPQDPQAFAVVIGLEKYRDVGGVEYAARDAQAVYSYLTESMGFKTENVILLKDERAGRSDLSTYLGPWLSDRASRGKSRVFIYYSGHGTVDPKSGETYLVPYDGDPAYPETKGFSLKDLYASLGRLSGAEVVVALDSCFSGTGGRSVLQPGIRPLVPVKATPLPENVVVLSASGSEQVSASHPLARHGLMTYFLLRGLAGEASADRNGKVTTLDLYRYLAPAVEAEARRQHVAQSPRLEPPPESIGDRGARVWLVRKPH